MRARRCPLYVAGVGALLLATSPAAAASRGYTVVIEKLKFGPLPSQLHKGDRIIWVNRDLFRHTATATDHSFDVDLAPGAQGAAVLKTKGVISFICRFHPGMRGTLVVK